MTGITVVPFNADSSGFADNMTLLGQHFCESVPVIRVKNTVFKVLYFVVQSSECFSITTTEYPGNSSPRAAINRFDEPLFSFFLPI